MRDRQEIENSLYQGSTHESDTADHTALIVELLLDIRDLLTAQPAQVGEG